MTEPPSPDSRPPETVERPMIAVAARVLARAVRGHIVREGEQLFIAAVTRDQIGEPIASRTPALGALDAHHVELADQVRKDDRAFAGHVCSYLQSE